MPSVVSVDDQIEHGFKLLLFHISVQYTWVRSFITRKIGFLCHEKIETQKLFGSANFATKIKLPPVFVEQRDR